MYLGLDLGTSGLKGSLLTQDGAVVADATASYEVQNPHVGWSEQAPSDWIAACRRVIGELRKQAPTAVQNLRAIGFAGHMHGAVVLDRDGEVIRPCILWNDMRSSKQAAMLDSMPEFRAVSGNIVFPGFTAPKLVWMAEFEPANFARVCKVLLPKDYLVFWLSGYLVSDRSDAAGTGMLDVAARDWAEPLVKAAGLEMEQVPRLVEGIDVVGEILNVRAEELGLPCGVRIVAGGADNAVAACGVGVMREGQGFVSLGTSGVFLVGKDAFAPAADAGVHTFCHALPDRWYQMGVTLSATASLSWLAGILERDVSELAELCNRPIAGPSSVQFLPYLSGERTPHNDAQIGGAFVGLRGDTDARDMVQAVMEGVSFALRDCYEALRQTGTQIEEVLVIGGGSKSLFWLETLANVLDLRLALPEQGEFGAAFGAARLAMIGDGAPTERVLVGPCIEKTIVPNAGMIPAYEAAYQKYLKLYPMIKQWS